MNDPGDIKTWRRTTRRALIAARLEAGRPRRQQWDRVIDEQLRRRLPEPDGLVFGVCWPFKGEYDGRVLIDELVDRGAVTALPVVTEPRAPLTFHCWRPGDPVIRGAHDIPVPRAVQVVSPDVLLAPMVGFDGNGYRLGYGTGHFDRTLAVASGRPLVIGVGYELSRLETIYPQEHDIPMDVVVTEQGVFETAGPVSG